MQSNNLRISITVSIKDGIIVSDLHLMQFKHISYEASFIHCSF